MASIDGIPALATRCRLSQAFRSATITSRPGVVGFGVAYGLAQRAPTEGAWSFSASSLAGAQALCRRLRTAQDTGKRVPVIDALGQAAVCRVAQVRETIDRTLTDWLVTATITLVQESA